MKCHIFFLLLFIVPLFLQAQVVLTGLNNGMISGDSSRYSELNYIDPGTSGAGQIWDFSSVQPTGKNPVSRVQSSSATELDRLKGNNLVLVENGYEYFLSSAIDGYQETGYVNKTNKMSMVFDDPIEKMKFPFSYGDQFTDHFSGTAFYNERSRIDLTGDYSVEADAFGTLVLPDRVLNDVLRVKTERKGLQIGVCGSTVSNVTKFYWYAPGYRYPVFSTSVVEVVHGAGEPIVTRSAFMRTLESGSETSTNVSLQNESGSGDVSVMMYPNPFSDKITYNYFLRNPLNVTVELFDITGSNRIKVLKNQIQPEGLHSGILEAVKLGLTPGVYHVRFTFDKQVVVHKIVKI